MEFETFGFTPLPPAEIEKLLNAQSKEVSKASVTPLLSFIFLFTFEFFEWGWDLITIIRPAIVMIAPEAFRKEIFSP